MADAITPSVGKVSAVGGGLNSGPTSSAAYSVPGWVLFCHLKLGSILVNGVSAYGCTHQAFSPRAYNTISCPGCAPRTRPRMALNFSGLSAPATGTLVNSTAGGPEARLA